MTLASFEAALERTDELELTTTGRVTGKPISCPVWFVRSGEKLYLVPGDGTDSQWYKNLLKTPAVRLAARGAQYQRLQRPCPPHLRPHNDRHLTPPAATTPALGALPRRREGIALALGDQATTGASHAGSAANLSPESRVSVWPAAGHAHEGRLRAAGGE